jgi:hypothetical protein
LIRPQTDWQSIKNMKLADTNHFYALAFCSTHNVWVTSWIHTVYSTTVSRTTSWETQLPCASTLRCESKMASAAVRTCSFLIKQHCLAARTKEFRAFIHSHVLFSGPSVKCRIPLCSSIKKFFDDGVWLTDRLPFVFLEFIHRFTYHVKTIPIHQSSIEMSPICNPFISNELT